MANPPMLAVILDGLGDRPHPDHDARTPLEAARTPVMDAMASRGVSGSIDPLGPGIVPGSGTGHLGLFGYDPLAPEAESPSRGCLEALGLGIEPAVGRVACRGNFVTLDGHGRIEDRRAGRFKTDEDQAEAVELVEAMDAATPEDVAFRYHPRMGYRFVIVLEDADPNVTDTDPGKPGQPRLEPQPTVDDPAAERTAKRLGEAIEAGSKVLADHALNEARAERGAPVANALVTRGLGPVERGTTLDERWGITSRAVAGGNAYRGIASYVGMALVDVEGATGDLRTDYDAKVQAALDAADAVDLVYLHIKAPDVCGENGDFEAKRDVLERIDAALGPIGEREDLVVGVTGDHSTPCIRASHSGDPVPLLIAGPGVLVDDVETFGERPCQRGGLQRLRGGDFLRSLLDLTDRTTKTE